MIINNPASVQISYLVDLIKQLAWYGTMSQSSNDEGKCEGGLT